MQKTTSNSDNNLMFKSMNNHKVITFGEIMLRLAAPGNLRFSQTNSLNSSFGGGEANVAISLSNFNIATEFVTCIPKNEIGDACVKELKKHNVGTHFINRSGERLGIYFLETGAVNRPSNVIYDRAYSAFSQLKKGIIDWDMVFEKATWFHWTGITPALSEEVAEVCQEAIEKARERNITVSCDLNYRKKLWNYGKSAQDVMPRLVAGCDIVLGNEEDAEMALGIKPIGVDIKTAKVSHEAYQSVSEQIMARFPDVKKVITTLRGSVNANHNTWSGVLYNGNELLKAQVYDITYIVDRVGAGDSFMAGLIYGLLTFNDDKKALDFAAAASCLKHTVYGDYNLVTVQEVENLLAGDTSGRVSR